MIDFIIDNIFWIFIVYFLIIGSCSFYLDGKFGIGGEDEPSFMFTFFPILPGVAAMVSFDGITQVIMTIAFICYIVLLGLTFYRERDTLKRVIKNKDKFRKESESANPFFIPTFVYFIFLVITLIITLL